MKSFKFRAWDEQNKCFYDDLVVIHPDGSILAYDPSSDSWTEEAPLQVQFFTGLHDKRGKEIFKGDIVIFKTFTKNDIEIVVFEKGSFGLHDPEQEKSFLSFYSIPEDFLIEVEVVGNIWEHKYLLEGK